MNRVTVVGVPLAGILKKCGRVLHFRKVSGSLLALQHLFRVRVHV
jgi:hypothetical protein